MSPDQIEAETFKYTKGSHIIRRLASGNIAVYSRDFKLQRIVSPATPLSDVAPYIAPPVIAVQTPITLDDLDF